MVVGVLYPRTDTSLLGKERHDDYHLSGWGVSAVAGVNISFLKHFYIQTEYKIGYINMPNIKTSSKFSRFCKSNFWIYSTNTCVRRKVLPKEKKEIIKS